jgi:hypothetical protein
MATVETTPVKPEAPPAAVSPDTRGLLLALTLLLVALAVFQLVILAPRSMVVVQHFAGHHVPAPLQLLMRIPEWASLGAGLLLGAFAVWHRRSLHRVALLATAALAINVGIFLAVLNSLVWLVSRSVQ